MSSSKSFETGIWDIRRTQSYNAPMRRPGSVALGVSGIGLPVHPSVGPQLGDKAANTGPVSERRCAVSDPLPS